MANDLSNVKERERERERERGERDIFNWGIQKIEGFA